MSVLILNRGAPAAYPFHEWFAESGEELLLLTSEHVLHDPGASLDELRASYAEVRSFTRYAESGLVELEALRIMEAHSVSHVLATSEFDLERAARLRARRGLPGQTLESAAAFRDKVRMKEIARRAGIPVADHQELRSVPDLVRFIARAGYPVVVKPRNGAGSMGTVVLSSQEDLRSYLEGDLGLHGPYRPNLMVEGYVAGELCHVDGLVLGGRIALCCPSRYTSSTLSFRHGLPFGSVMLEGPLRGRLADFTERLLAAFPAPLNFSFHAEVFHCPDDRLVLCEVASRTGGAGIRQAVLTVHGMDISECWLRADLGLDLPPARPPEGRTGGWVLIPRRPGTVRRAPVDCPLPGITEYRLNVREGEQVGDARSSVDGMASFIAVAADEAECERRLRRAAEWFESELLLD